MKGYNHLESIEKKSFIKSLKLILTEEAIQKFSDLKEFFLVNDLKRMNLKSHFDYQRLEFFLGVPIDDYLPIDLKSRGSRPNWMINSQQAEKVSGYLNYSLDKSVGDLGQSEDDFRSNYEAVLNLNGIVFENDYRYYSNEDKLYRESSIITKHFEKRLSKLEVGDVITSTSGVQSSLTLSGLSYSTDFSIDPFMNVRAVSEEEFLLSERSRVKIFINGRLIKSVILNKGKHRISSLNLSNGLNVINLEIEDFEGNKSFLTLNDVTSDRLLRKGIHKYSYVAGVKREQGVDGLDYNRDSDGVQVNILHEYGFSNKLTASLFGQGDFGQYQLGPKVKLASSLGLFVIDVGLSSAKKTVRNIQYERKGIKTISEHYLQFSDSRSRQKTISTRHTYTSPNYTNIDSITSVNNIVHDFSTRYNQILLSSLSLNLGVQYGIHKDSHDLNTYSFNSGLTIRSFNKTNINLSFNRIKNISQQLDSRFSAYITYRFDDPAHSLAYYYSDQNKSSQLEWNKTPRGRHSSYGAQAQLTKSENEKGLNVNSTLLHQKFRTTITGEANKIVSQETKKKGSVNLAGAISFAGKSFAFSRPIRNSFAIMTASSGINDSEIIVNKKKSSSAGIISKHMNAVLPELQPYQFFRVKVDPNSLAHNQQMRKDHFAILPKYKTGHLINVEVKESYLVEGLLKDNRGIPHSLMIGKILNHEGEFLYDFFTNSKGRFLIEGLEVGKYFVLINNKKVSFEVKSTSQSVFNVGELVL